MLFTQFQNIFVTFVFRLFSETITYLFIVVWYG